MRWQEIRRKPLTRFIVLALLTLLLGWSMWESTQVGAVDVSASTIWKATADKLPLGYTSDLDYRDRFVQRDSRLILYIRFPRVAMAVLVGMGLALAGAALQGALRNPLADPSLIGVSSGAAVGAVTALAGDWTLTIAQHNLGVAGASFVGAMLSTLLVYRLAYFQRRTNPTTMLLIGVAFSTIASAYVGLMTFRAGQEKVGDILFWTLGTLGGITWDDVEAIYPFVLGSAVLTLFTARALNVMALGETEAGYLGVDVQRLRLMVIVLSAILTGIGVAYVGIIALVGLVVPHLMRLLFGPDHRLLLPASLLGGAIFLLGADILARTLVKTSEIPLGVVTTLLGGPVFLLLILLYQRRGVRL